MAYHLNKRRKKKIRFARTKDIALLLLLAEQKGFFHDHGVKDIEFISVPYARKAMEMLIEGEADIITMIETNTAYLGYLKPKKPIKCILSVEKRTADNILIHGHNKTPNDIIGKIVGFMPRTTSHTFLIQFLKEHQINKNEITLKAMSPQALPNAFIKGEIDVMSLWQPYTNNTMLSMDDLGKPYTHFGHFGEHVSEVVMACTKELTIKNRKLIENIMRALMDAQNFYKENPQLTYEILAETMKISGKWYGKVLGDYIPECSIIGQTYIENVENISEWIRENDTEFMGKEKPNYLDFIDNSYFLDLFPEKQ